MARLIGLLYAVKDVLNTDNLCLVMLFLIMTHINVFLVMIRTSESCLSYPGISLENFLLDPILPYHIFVTTTFQRQYETTERIYIMPSVSR